MTMHPVVSDNVRAVGDIPSSQTVRVQFRSGGVYEYCGVGRGLFDEMLRPHPWRRVGRHVRAHAYAMVG